VEDAGRDALDMDDIFQFEGFRLHPSGGGLFRRDEHGRFVPMTIGSRALDVLGVLAGRPGDLVSRDEIIAAVWPSTVVEDSNLNMQIAALRRVLDDGRADGSCIQTIPGRGYRFTTAVTRVAAEARSKATPLPQSGIGGRPRLSIVVLPFANLSDDPQQQYFADGITDDLTTDLSRIPDMFVISRNTAFTYRNKLIDTKQLGRELGVRYVLEGSVRRSGSQIRVNTQLIDAETDAHLWAERFDRDTGELFILQNEITSRIAVALDLELIGAEAARPTENPDALDFILRGRAATAKPRTPENWVEVVSLFERALALDLGSVEAQSWLAIALTVRVLGQMTDSAAADMARAEGLTGRALAASPRSLLAHYAKGQVLRAQGRYKEAISEYETVIALNRNWVGAISSLGWCKFYIGSIEETIPLVEQAIRLSPRDGQLENWYWRIGVVHLVQARLDAAIRWFEKTRSVNPSLVSAHAFLAAAYALKNETERAAAELAEVRRLNGAGFYSSIARLRETGYFGVPEVLALFETTFFAGLRKAGMPEK
jgi:TolB-like protein/lipopolysaccharide biosynthesis regulator YciM